MRSDVLDDLDDIPPPRRVGRHLTRKPPKEDKRLARLNETVGRPAREREKAAEDVDNDPDNEARSAATMGASTRLLAKMFGTTRAIVERKLHGVAPQTVTQNGAALYSIATAAPYLIPPRVDDLGKIIANMKPDDLPDKLRTSYWDAQLKKQKWMVNAGELWHTEHVFDIITELFKEIRETLKLWPEDLYEGGKVDDEQYKAITEMVDDLNDKLHEKIVAFSENSHTPPMSASEDDVSEV